MLGVPLGGTRRVGGLLGVAGRLSGQYVGTSLVAQLVKNPPAMQETLVWLLGWKDPLEKG